MTSLLVPVLLTLLLQAIVFLGAAWLAERLGWVRSVAAREFLWRSAVLGGLVAAGLQLSLGAFAPGATMPPALQIGIPNESEPLPSVPGEAPLQSAVAVMPRAPTASSAASAPFVPAAVSTSAAPAANRSRDASAAPAVERYRDALATPTAEHSRDASAALSHETALSDASLAQIAPAHTPATSPDAATTPHQLGRLILAALPWLAALWLAGTVWQLLRLTAAAFALRRLRRATLLLEAPEWQADAAALAAQFGRRTPELHVATSIDSPLATPGGLILLPVWALPLTAAQRRALLAHELAHLCRRDPLWRAGLAVWRGLLWPLPLAAHAVQRLDALAELQSDAAAARLLGDGRALAECLAHCLEQRQGVPFPAFAAAMAAPRSPLLQRAERLLEGVPMSVSTIPWRGRVLPLLAVTAAVIGLPVFVAPLIAAQPHSSISISSEEDCDAASSCTSTRRVGDSTTMSFSSAGRNLRYQSSGKVRFDAAGTTVESLAADATASLQERVDGVLRRVEFRGGAQGVETRYWRDGKEQAFDADARAWLARTLPQLLREAAINVPERVARLYREGGAKAVIDEVGLIESDYSRGRHLAELLRSHKLAPAELDAALLQVGKMGSDYEKRQALTATLRSQQIGPEQWLKVLQTAAAVGSSYERAELLIQSAERSAADATLRKAWLAAAAGLDSDYERRRSLDALVDHLSDDAALRDVLGALEGIGSDFERREVLSHVAGQADEAEAIAVPYAQAVGEIGSDFERREALLALVRKGKLQRPGALAVLDVVAGIDSDFECRSVLVELAPRLPDDAAVRERLIQVAAKLSGYEREQVEAAAGLTRG